MEVRAAPPPCSPRALTARRRLFDHFPDAQALRGADVGALQRLLHPLGMYRRRARLLVRFSAAFLDRPWSCPSQLPGVGRYAADAYWMFCQGRWRDVRPRDYALRAYRAWLLSLPDAVASAPGGAPGGAD